EISSLDEQSADAFNFLRQIEIEDILQHFDLLKNIPKFPIMDYQDYSPLEVAASCRTYWNLPRGPIKNLTNLLESKGLIIFPLDGAADEYDGFSFWTSSGHPLVFINVNMPADRYRFTLAHELGHLVMHSKGGLDIENQANLFALHFLVPDQDIKHQLRNINFSSLKDLKRTWGVSIQALGYKAKHLGFINDLNAIYTKLYNNRYSKTNEPVTLPKEQPQLLYMLCRSFFESLNYSLDEFCRLVNLNKNEAKSIYRVSDEDIEYKNFIKNVKASDFNHLKK
ncbi:MAG: ImmA/IrrE family metallo-endopeptidase, partial [Candidatus Caenarcaniphilales bacterium]|nr:ImmA/IrrE family metallo-endopeptidase [Candidatus Caenarcaniphilales bacterium]